VPAKVTRSGWRSVWPGVDRREQTLSLTVSGLVALGILVAAWGVPWPYDLKDDAQLWLSLLCLPSGVLAGIFALPAREMLEERRQRRRAWRDAVGTWTIVNTRLFPAGSRTFNASSDEVLIAGVRDGVRVQVRCSPAGGGGWQRSMQITATEDPGLDLAFPHIDRWADKVRPVPPLGDAGFDARVSVLGDITRTLAVMDDRARTALRVLSRRYLSRVDLTSKHAVLSLRRQWPRLGEETLPAASEEIVELVEGACAVITKLRVSKGDFAARLSQNVKMDRSQWVRCRSLQLLSSEYGTTPALDDAIAASARDSSQAVRAVAAVLHGHASGLNEIGRLMARDNAPDGVRLGAFVQVLDRFPASAVNPVIKQALRSSCVALRARALEAAVQSGDEQLVLEACHLLKGKAADQGPATIRTLIKANPTCLEVALLELVSCAKEEVSMPAIVALGKVGGDNAIAPLVLRLDDPSVAQVARQSLRQIRSRTGAAHDGRLSLAPQEGASGALSLTAKGGELSIDDD
jgi:hypothetical protein